MMDDGVSGLQEILRAEEKRGILAASPMPK